jgi:hypothetical protein
MYQEIATSGYALLAMTWKFSPDPSIGGAEAATPGGVALRRFPVKRKNVHRLLKLCGQIPRKSRCKPLHLPIFPAKPQKTPQTFQSLWSKARSL